MTDSTHHAQDDLDAGWDEDVPKSDLDQLDQGWEQGDDSSSQETDVSSDVNRKRSKTIGKKDRRQLERQTRSHQAEMDLENRKQRKAARRELARQRAVDLGTQRDQQRQQELDRQQQKAARRAELQKSKPAPKAAAPARVDDLSATSLVANAGAPNRAERRSKSGTSSRRGTSNVVVSSPAARKATTKTFALFISVVFVLSVLSYLVIR